MFKKIFLWGAVAAFLAAPHLSCSSTEPPAQTPASLPQEETRTESEVIKIKIETSLGNIEAELYPQDAPKTVENFVTLTKKGFYDGIIFHRVIPDFMIQTGDPTGTGMGGPGYKFQDEFSSKRHDSAGVLSMANSGPNTNGSQFFITDAATPWLDGRHSVFGKVTSGLDVVKAIARTPRGPNDKPVTPVAMKKVSVLEK
ncbi:MAG: peptidylprolyl isomerase [Candidatus Omnitrophica bacterium]|nr:peptidylprolyl isomerase [Candidatus Omnitrophota bacterium]